MNSQNAIIVLIDVAAALKANSLPGNIYLINNNRSMGSTGLGSEHLITAVPGNRILNWLVGGIDQSGTQPVLVDIGGEAVDMQIMVPQLFDSPDLSGNLGLWWGATVDASVAGIYTYTLYFDIGGRRLQFDSSIDVKPEFTIGGPLGAIIPRRARAMASTSLQTRAIADGSILNPDNHVSLFPRGLLKNR